MATPRLLSEECSVAINHVAAHELHISDAYLSMACYYFVGPGEPRFPAFFGDQAELKREYAMQFLRYLRRRDGKICLPVIKRPEIDNWGTGIQGLNSALEMENHLTKLLLDLKTIATVSNDSDEVYESTSERRLEVEGVGVLLLCFMETYLDKQKENTNFLEEQIVYLKELEKQAQEGEDQFKKPAEVSDLKTTYPEISKFSYLPACNYIEVPQKKSEEKKEGHKAKGPLDPIFVGFFEDQAEVKREHGKQFLSYLKGRGRVICLPVIKRPEMDTWGTGVKALECALELENQLSQLLLDLKTLASANNDYHLLDFMGKYLEKQKRNATYLQHQIAYHKKLEK